VWLSPIKEKSDGHRQESKPCFGKSLLRIIRYGVIGIGRDDISKEGITKDLEAMKDAE